MYLYAAVNFAKITQLHDIFFNKIRIPWLA